MELAGGAIAVLFIFGTITFIIIMATGIRIIRPWEQGLVERLGRYQRTVESGLNIIIPIVDRLRVIDMREQVVDVPPQDVIMKDNIVVQVEAVVYYEVTDPIKVTYNVANFYMAGD